MTIYTLNGLNGIDDIIETFQSVIWNMQFWGFGDFELVVPGTEENLNRLPKWKLLVRDTDIETDPEDETIVTYRNVMQIRERKISFDIEEGWLLTLRGSGLKRMVGQRIVWEQTNISGTIESGIRQVITDNIIAPDNTARKIDDFILSAAKGYTETIDTQLFGDNIADWLQETCEMFGYGWDVYISGGKYVFEIKKGTDRTYDQNTVTPVVFSPEFDNLNSSGLETNEAEFSNAALIGGEGDGTDQVVTTVGTAAGLQRFESYVDAGSLSSNGQIITMQEYIKMLQTYGATQLSKVAQTEKLTGEIIHNGIYELNRDYFLGDLVQLKTDFFDAKSRIIEMIYCEDETGSTLVPTFGAWND